MKILKSLFSIYFILLVSEVFSQTNKIDLGFEGGAGLIFLRGSESVVKDQKPALGFGGGFFYQYNFNKTLSIRTALGLELKGAAYSVMLTDEMDHPINEVKIKDGLTYLTLPVLLRAGFGEKHRFFFNAGPYFGYLLNQSSQGEGFTLSTTTYKRIDMGLTSGLGFSIPIKTKSAFSIEMRYNLGLYDINDPELTTSDEPVRTNSLNILLAYTRKFGFKD